MVGYVLLIIIAIGLSVAVYAYLKLYLPEEKTECREDIIISIDKFECNSTANSTTIGLTNRGLFNVDGAYIRVGDDGRLHKDVLNEIDNYRFKDNSGSFSSLTPGESWEQSFAYRTEPGIKEIEIEPLMFINNKPVLCDKSVITLRTECYS